MVVVGPLSAATARTSRAGPRRQDLPPADLTGRFVQKRRNAVTKWDSPQFGGPRRRSVMSTTTTRNGPISTASDPRVIQRPPVYGPGPPHTPPPVGRGHWYRRGWVIALGALLVGVGIGAAEGSTKTAPRAATVTALCLTASRSTVPSGVKCSLTTPKRAQRWA